MSEPQSIPRSERVPAPAIPFEPAQLRRRYDGWTAEKQIRFIEALATSKCVDEACRIVGMSDTSAYQLRNRPAGAAFARAWDLALDCQMPELEQAAFHRARFGVSRPIFYKGDQVGEYRHFDERLTMFMLRSRRPRRYGRWLDREAPPPEPQRGPSPPNLYPEDDEPQPMTLEDCIEEISICGPGAHGNLCDEWQEGFDVDEQGNVVEEGAS
jgi:hypothetical protein